MNNKTQVAVVVENHPYDVISFQKMLDSFTDCDCYVQPFDLLVQDEDNKDKYDTILFYNMNWDCPPSESHIYKYMENETGNGQGVILLHHALLSFQKWDVFTDISGVRLRGADGLFKYTQNQTVKSHIVKTGHYITAGVSDFTVIDETYTMGEPEEPGNTILITTDNATSIKNIAWVRQYKNSRVFSYASGHDKHSYNEENFRRILHNAIIWTASK